MVYLFNKLNYPILNLNLQYRTHWKIFSSQWDMRKAKWSKGYFLISSSKMHSSRGKRATNETKNEEDCHKAPEPRGNPQGRVPSMGEALWMVRPGRAWRLQENSKLSFGCENKFQKLIGHAVPSPFIHQFQISMFCFWPHVVPLAIAPCGATLGAVAFGTTCGVSQCSKQCRMSGISVRRSLTTRAEQGNHICTQ